MGCCDTFMCVMAFVYVGVYVCVEVFVCVIGVEASKAQLHTTVQTSVMEYPPNFVARKQMSSDRLLQSCM